MCIWEIPTRNFQVEAAGSSALTELSHRVTRQAGGGIQNSYSNSICNPPESARYIPAPWMPLS